MTRYQFSCAFLPTDWSWISMPSDDPVHGNQEVRFYQGYYDDYCFLPLHVFCGGHPLLSWLHPPTPMPHAVPGAAR